MPMYTYECHTCGHQEDFYSHTMSGRPKKKSLDCVCGAKMYRAFGALPSVFTPYVERNFTGKPIEITTAAQRDALCKQHDCSYDTIKYTAIHKRKRENPLEQVGFKSWAKEMKKEGLL